MIFEFDNPKGCQSCPFCFTPEKYLLIDMDSPSCKLKEAKGETDISIYATFGTTQTIDENCPANKLKKVILKSIINNSNDNSCYESKENGSGFSEGYDSINPNWYWNGDGTVTINGEIYSSNCIDCDTMM